MRVVEVIKNYTPGDGITHAAVQIADALSKMKGFEVTLLYENHKPPIDCAVQKSFASSIKYIAANADIAHSHIGTGILKCVAAKAIRPSIRHVNTYSVIAPPQHYPFYKRAMAFHSAAYAWGLDAAVGISKYACNDFEEKFGREATLIYDGVDPKEFKPNAKAGAAYRRRHKIDADAPVIGYVSKFNAHKNHESAIRAMKRMPKDAILLLGGASASKDTDSTLHCRALAHKLGLADRVKFLGFVPQADLSDFYNAIDVHAFPSLWEGFGLNVLEASATGKPTVAYKLYSIQELVGEKQGNGHAVYTQKQFEDALLNYIENPATARKTGVKARKFALGFAWEKVAANYAKLFKQIA